MSLESRRTNLPEIISEGLACILFNACRTNNKKFKCHSSFDCVDENGTSYQIKAVSTLSKNEEGGPTSFGPKSEWDKLVLMHFICENDTVEIYLFDKNIQDIVYLLHSKAYWVVCIDSGMDGAVLKNDEEHKDEYSIIGFSTGKGVYGQYNLTVTTRSSILDSIRQKVANRLKRLFKWEQELIEKVTSVCIKEAGKLDGISLFSAINPKDHNMN